MTSLEKITLLIHHWIGLLSCFQIDIILYWKFCPESDTKGFARQMEEHPGGKLYKQFTIMIVLFTP